jgi:cobalt-zinc-cadmium efflux system outer membrane protein
MPFPGKRVLPSICLGLILWLPFPSRGETPLRWDDLVARLPDHPAAREGLLEVEIARGAADEARQLPNPTVEGTLARAEESGDTGLEWGAAVTLPLDWLATRGPEVDAADASVEEARQRWAARRRELLDRLRTLFYGLAHDREHVASVETEVAGMRELAKLVRLRVERGEARPIEALQAETELDRTENDLDRARAELETRQLQLRLLLPELGEGPFAPVADLDTEPPPDLTASLDRIRAGAPEVRASRARQRAAEAELSREKRRRLPELAVSGFTDRELDKRVAGGVLEVELPLLSWNGGGVRRAEASLEAARAARETATREALAAFAEAHRSCERERRVAARYANEIAPRAEKTLEMLEKTFRVGETTLLDVLDARRTAGATRREALESRLSAKLACERVAALLAENAK